MARDTDTTVPIPEPLEIPARPAPTASALTTLASTRGGLERLPVGTALGRYTILELRGAGGMGVVYGAYDPKLDRRVALKLLRASGEDGDRAGARLLREAQALAKLSHPNVVAVHDSGKLGDVVFVEMELVDGPTLDEWAKGKDWRAILGAYLDAGRALAAVHRVGLVHRDFKPSNAIVDSTGRVRVLDFGIARLAHTMPPEPDAPPPSEGLVRAEPPSKPELEPTFAGRATGTPAYMAPEQWRGLDDIDARADQYAFAASLFRTFYGFLPFAAKAHDSMANEASRGPIAARPSGTKVAAYVHRAIVRALAYAPRDRFPTMEALIAALVHDPQATWRRRAAGGLVVCGLASVAVIAWRRDVAREARACAADDKLAGAWDEDKARRVHDAMTKSEKPGAEESFVRTKALLDAYASGWNAMRTDACKRSREVSRSTEDAALGARLVCLDWRLRELRSLTDVLAADPSLGPQGAIAASGLTPLTDCNDPSLREIAPADPMARAKLDAIRGKLAEVDSLRLARKAKAARPLATAAADEAKASGVRDAEVLALLALGRVETTDGDYKAAAATLEQAVWAAEAARDDVALVSATSELALVTGYRLADTAAGARWEKHAVAALERAGSPDTLASAVDRMRASLARDRHDLPASLAHAERALTETIRAYGPEHLQVATAEHELANTLTALDRFDDAMEHYRRSQRIRETVLGPSHPDVAAPLVSMAIVERKRGNAPAAIPLYRRALALVEPAYGPEHPETSLVLNNLALALVTAGEIDEGATLFERAYAIKRKVYGDDHPLVASALTNLGFVDYKRHRLADSREKNLRAIAIREKHGGKDDADLATPLLSVSRIELDLGHPKDAMAYAERALAIREKKLGSDHPETGAPLTAIARVHLAEGRADLALPLAERAVKLLEHTPGESLADARFALARALDAAQGDATRARVLAREAADTYDKETSPGAHNDELDAMRSWLSAR
ncbi:MAG TPA: serine/threonine-protein kinase [Labilithrix sp.]